MPVKRYVEQVDRNRYYYFDDFGGGNYDSRTWGVGGTAGGGVAKLSAIGGQIRVTVGGTAGNEYYIVQDTFRNFNVSGPCEISLFAKIENLANFSAQFGFQTDGTHHIEIASDSATSTNWVCWCQNGAGGGNLTQVISGLAVDTNWHRLRILCSAASVSFFVDSTLIGTIVTNIPAGDLGPIAYGYRNAGGAGTRSFLVDWCEAIGARA